MLFFLTRIAVYTARHMYHTKFRAGIQKPTSMTVCLGSDGPYPPAITYWEPRRVN